MKKILDMSIDKTDKGWLIYVPIKTGSIEITVPHGNTELNRFFDTVYNTPLRRFGEDPQRQ